jgi:long-chain acyl-CoA synthetase
VPEHVGGVLRGDRFVSSEELDRRARQAASGLASLGVREGDSVALLMRNDHEFFEASFAATALGAAPVPIHWHGTAEEIAYVLADCQSEVLVAHGDLLARVSDRLDRRVRVLGVPTPDSICSAFSLAPGQGELANDVTPWSTWLESFAPLDAVHVGEVATMIYTSGTTGHPKGVRRLPGTRHYDEGFSYVADIERYFGHWGSMRSVLAGPLYHSAPNAYATLALRAYNGFVVIQDRFDPEGLLALVERHRITSLYLVPTMFVRLLRLPRAVRESYDLSSLRQISHTAAPCAPDVKRALIEWLGPIVTELYGSTEVSFVAGCTSEEWLTNPGTVGRALANCEIRVYDENATALGVGEVGEIFVKAHSQNDFTYHGRHDARREVERDGLVMCGDVGYVDDGFLYLCDRVRDMIISGGVNIYPIEIEATLLQLPGVADCAVFGIPDDEFGESVAAAIKLEEGSTLTGEDIQAHVRENLAGFKVPRVVTFHDALPREDSGKMFKRKLRAPYWENAGRSI